MSGLLNEVTLSYVDRLVEDNGRAKVLLLDSDTTAILSLASTQSRLLRKDVFLIDKIDNYQRQKMRHLDCTVFVRPTSASISSVLEELHDPKYGKYSLVFSNLLRKSQLERMAEADDYSCVERVQEMLLDYLKINTDFFHCNVPIPWASSYQTWDTEAFETCSESMFAMIASLKIGKPQLRYDINSSLSRQFVQKLGQELQANSGILPSSNKKGQNLVLVLDRFNDPVTPLISHWTYQAMVDELLGIVNNRVDLHLAPDVPPSHREIVLSQDQDAFFKDSMFLNFGDLGAAVRDYVQHYSSKSKSSEQLETVADIKKFVDMLPDFRKLQDNTTKHVSLVGELSRLVSEEHLLEVSEVEQSLACSDNHSADLQSIRKLIALPNLSPVIKYRVVCLYGLRFRTNSQSQFGQLMQALKIQYGDNALDSSVHALMKIYSANKFPQEDLFSQGSLFNRAQLGLKGLRGVENVYTQHKPLLESILSLLVRNKLPIEKYPFTAPPNGEQELGCVLIFVIGGVTFEEARVVGEWNKLGNTPKVILGGTDVINPKKFLRVIEETNWS